MRLFVDLGSAVSFGMEHMFGELAAAARAGRLGAARVTNEVAALKGNSFDGANVSLRNWMQPIVTAKNVAGTTTLVGGQYVAFVRQGEDNLLVAGKDLAHALGYCTPLDQQEMAACTATVGDVGVDQERLLGGRQRDHMCCRMMPGGKSRTTRKRSGCEAWCLQKGGHTWGRRLSQVCGPQC
jgi:hypothetical protein